MKAYLIARVSDEDQRKALPAQKLRLARYAEERGYEAEYREFDESAYKDGPRQEFQEIISEIKTLGEPCIVVFDKIDRFTRDSTQGETKVLMDLVKRGRLEMHFPSDNLFINQFSPATDLFRLNIGMALAKYYSDTISDNVKRRTEQLLKDGHWPGWAPIGYVNNRTDKDNTTIDIDPGTAPHIVRAFEMRACGSSYPVIAKTLKEDGLRGKGKARAAVSKSYVEKIMRNPFYYGQMRYDGNLYPHIYEPLISRELFNKCQDVKAERGYSRTKVNGRPFTLKGFVKCSYCGCTASSYYGRKQVYLKCTGAKGKCGNVNSPESVLMPDVVTDLGDIAIPESAINQVIAELKKRHENHQLYYTQSIDQTRRDYDRVKERLKILYFDRMDGRITVQMYDEYVRDLTREQEDLNARLMKLTASNKSFMVTASYLLDLAQRASALFECSQPVLRQKLLKFLLSNVELSDRKLRYKLNEPYRTFKEYKKRALVGSETANWCPRRESNPRRSP